MITENDRAKHIFLNAAEIAAEDVRQDYVDAKCGDDVQLQREVNSLLEYHGLLGQFLEPCDSEVAATIDTPMAERPGTQVGRYKLVKEIGSGGMGVVFLAEQREPVKRQVALKIIKPGMDTREVIARFTAEQQALALMDHPHIAHVFDAGATDFGRSYFAMELVPGEPITKFCQRTGLSTRGRLELIINVCRAVQHAHQKGIIHRDLKPSNVLVTLQDGQPVAKVIDFGVAKALGAQLNDNSVYSMIGQFIGTPTYMSPEQAALSIDQVDTPSDVYVLGVLLYELLTGAPPFDRETLKQVGLDEFRRMIQEVEPIRPSVEVSTRRAENVF